MTTRRLTAAAWDGEQGGERISAATSGRTRLSRPVRILSAGCLVTSSRAEVVGGFPGRQGDVPTVRCPAGPWPGNPPPAATFSIDALAPGPSTRRPPLPVASPPQMLPDLTWRIRMSKSSSPEHPASPDGWSPAARRDAGHTCGGRTSPPRRTRRSSRPVNSCVATPARRRRSGRCAGCDAVVHLAAWHNGHRRPSATTRSSRSTSTAPSTSSRPAVKPASTVSCSPPRWRTDGVASTASPRSSARICGGCTTRSPAPRSAILRYHDFVPEPYLRWGDELLRNGVDDAISRPRRSRRPRRRSRTGDRPVPYDRPQRPPAAHEVRADFAAYGAGLVRVAATGRAALMSRHGSRSRQVEQHDLSEAADLLGWRPATTSSSS